jgi:hypothetical protein
MQTHNLYSFKTLLVLSMAKVPPLSTYTAKSHYLFGVYILLNGVEVSWNLIYVFGRIIKKKMERILDGKFSGIKTHQKHISLA